MTETIPAEVIEKMAKAGWDESQRELTAAGVPAFPPFDTWEGELSEHQDTWRNFARAALKAAEAAGFVMVPVEATDHMVNKGYEKANNIGPNVFGAIPDTACDLAYRAMIAARPKVP